MMRLMGKATLLMPMIVVITRVSAIDATKDTCQGDECAAANFLQHDAQLGAKLSAGHQREGVQEAVGNSFDGLLRRMGNLVKRVSTEHKLFVCHKLLEGVQGYASTNVTASRLESLHQYCPRAYSSATCDVLTTPAAFKVMETAVGDPCMELKVMLDAAESHGARKPIILKQEPTSESTVVDPADVTIEQKILACKDILLKMEEYEFYVHNYSTPEEKLEGLSQFCTAAFSDAACERLVTPEAVDVLTGASGDDEICSKLDSMLEEAEQSGAKMLERRSVTLEKTLTQKSKGCICGDNRVWCGPKSGNNRNCCSIAGCSTTLSCYKCGCCESCWDKVFVDGSHCVR